MADDDKPTNSGTPKNGDYERLKACTQSTAYQNSPSGSNVSWYETTGNSQLKMGPNARTLSIDDLGPKNYPQPGKREDIVAFVETDGRATKLYIQDGREEPGAFSAAKVEGQMKNGKLTVGLPSVGGTNVSETAAAKMAENAKRMADEIQSCVKSPSSLPLKKPEYGYKP